MEVGFFHPDRGYWQSSEQPPADILLGYPEGTIQVPLKPGPNYEWTELGWVELEPPATPVPVSVTMRQARLALLAQGLLSSVDPLIDALPSPQKEAARIEWEYASEIRRDSALMAQIGAALSLTSTQIDDLFIAAVSL